MNQVYEDLINTIFDHWESGTTNSEIAAGVKEFQEHMENWVRRYALSPGAEEDTIQESESE